MSENPDAPIKVSIVDKKEFDPYDSYQTEMDDIEMTEQEISDFND